MKRIRYAMFGPWTPVADNEARAITEAHERRYRSRLWSNPAVRLTHDTERLRDLTSRIRDQTEGMRQQVAKNDEDAVLTELRKEFG